MSTKRVPPAPRVASHVSQVERSLRATTATITCLAPRFDQVSITLVDGQGRLSTCAHAGGRATELDRLQYRSGEGPLLEALRTAAPVVVPHLQREDRWRGYLPSAAPIGARSQIAVPLSWRGDRPSAVLNLYSTTTGDIDPEALQVVLALAAQAESTLAGLCEIESLRRALASRTTIGAAVGLLMARYDLTEEAAFAVLRRRSSHANLKVRDIAGAMVEAWDGAVGVPTGAGSGSRPSSAVRPRPATNPRSAVAPS